MQTVSQDRQPKVMELQHQVSARYRLKHKAGIALLRPAPTGPEVLLVQQVNGHWSLPKGKQKHGEAIKQTSLRECREETGYEAADLHFVGWGVNSRKHVRFYLWKSNAPVSCQAPSLRRREIRQIAWFALAQAQRLLKPWQRHLLAKIAG